MASYTFPIPGWTGTIEPHWGSDRGAADLFAAIGTPVVSMTSGKVDSVGTGGLGGNNVEVHGDDGLDYYYAHFVNPPLVRVGDRVQAGTRLGAVGISGNAAGTTPHLHIGIGHGIASGSGPHGGAGESFDATSFLQQVYSGGGSSVSGALSPTGDTTAVSYPLPSAGGAAAAVGESAAGALLTQILAAFSAILRGGK